MLRRESPIVDKLELRALEFMSHTPAEPLSCLSVIPEATEENRGSTFFVARPIPKLEENKEEIRTLAESSAAYHSQEHSSSQDCQLNEFRSVALVGKQPYASCCCCLS